MSQTSRALEAAALLLPPEERARLAERLLASLEVDPEIEAARAAEVKRRIEEWEAGVVEAVSWEEARERIEAALNPK